MSSERVVNLIDFFNTIYFSTLNLTIIRFTQDSGYYWTINFEINVTSIKHHEKNQNCDTIIDNYFSSIH